jgi:hypothetical protein
MTTYEEVAQQTELDAETQAVYVAYMRARWADDESLQCQTGYAKEWAERFKHNREYQASDHIGQAILRRLRPGFYEAQHEYYYGHTP